MTKLIDMATQIARPAEPEREPERQEPFTVERQGDKLVITVDCSEQAVRYARTTSSGNAKLLASSWSLPNAQRGWADCGNGIGLNLAVTHRDHAPVSHRRRYSRTRWPRAGEDWR